MIDEWYQASLAPVSVAPRRSSGARSGRPLKVGCALPIRPVGLSRNATFPSCPYIRFVPPRILAIIKDEEAAHLCNLIPQYQPVMTLFGKSRKRRASESRPASSKGSVSKPTSYDQRSPP